MRLIIASNNAGKKAELARILGGLGFGIVTAAELGIIPPEPEETGATFAENALIKARAFMEASGLPAIADDSGLCVDALGGAPGVHTARFAGPGATDGTNIDKLLTVLEGVPEGKRGAHYVCHITCLFPDGRQIDAEGRCGGFIGTRRLGTGGFGYDPVFMLSPGVSMAMLPPDEKDALSHRGRALSALAEQLRDIQPLLQRPHE